MFNKKRYILPLVAILTVVLFVVLPYESRWVEVLYSKGLFHFYRVLYDSIFGWLPVPIIYIWLILWIYYLYKVVKKGWRSAFLGLSTLISVHIIVFYWCWAFNYKRIDHIHHMVNTDIEISTDELYSELQRVTDSLLTIRAVLSAGYSIDWEQKKLSPLLYRDHLEQTLSHLSLPLPGSVRVRKLYPKGSLLHWSTAGVYLPWAGEGHIDPGLHPITWPFTMTHEMSHGYGYTSEDVCNFLALLTCINSDKPLMKYSGYFGYWRYLRANAYLADKERYAVFSSSLPPAIRMDLSDINTYSDRYPDIMPMVRDLFYDRYLRSHGVSAGLQSYSHIIVLAMAWQRQRGSLSF